MTPEHDIVMQVTRENVIALYSTQQIINEQVLPNLIYGDLDTQAWGLAEEFGAAGLDAVVKPINKFTVNGAVASVKLPSLEEV